VTRYQEQVARLKNELAAYARATHKAFWIVSLSVVALWIVVFVVPVPQGSPEQTASTRAARLRDVAEIKLMCPDRTIVPLVEGCPQPSK
jgi:hypothetical protein